MRSKRWLPIAGLATFILVVAIVWMAGSGERRFSATRIMLGTDVTVTVVSSGQASAKANMEAAFARIAALEKCLSAHTKDSELSRAVRSSVHEPVSISPDLFAALSAGAAWHKRTKGTFDITIGPLLSLWKKCGKENRLPSDKEIEEAKSRMGVPEIVLDPAARTIRLSGRSLQIDLGGLGKGFCADEAAKTLRKRGVDAALVAVAGDIYALGSRPDGTPWSVGVQDPRDPNNRKALLTTLYLTDWAVSTSGNYQRFVTIQGQRYSHIVDPRTGRPADAVPSVTVVGPNTLTTDILGTALSILGVEDGLAMVEDMPGIEALFVTVGANKQLHLTRSRGFARYEMPNADKSDSRKTTADR